MDTMGWAHRTSSGCGLAWAGVYVAVLMHVISGEVVKILNDYPSAQCLLSENRLPQGVQVYPKAARVAGEKVGYKKSEGQGVMVLN